MLNFFGSSDIKGYLRHYLQGIPLKGRRVIDIPAGRGETAKLLHQLGADVHAYDLFPEVFTVTGLECHEVDLMEEVPEEGASADMIICQEGLEHLPNQLQALKEFNRILKTEGRLLITVPSISHLRARMSHLLSESELYSRMPSNELDALWYAADGKQYYGHLFMIGIQRLRILAIAAGFRIVKVHRVKVSYGALLWFPLYPLIVLVNAWAYLKNVYRHDSLDRALKKRVYGEQMRLNLHPTILFGRHLFIEFIKVDEHNTAPIPVNARY